MDDERRVVVGIDGSPPARCALRWALAEAQLLDRTLEVLHAWREPAVLVPEEYDSALVEAGHMDEAALKLIDRELDAVGADLPDTFPIERTEVHGFAARALVEASQRAELVVVGRRGMGGFPHELIGPKAVQVAHHARSPVAVVPDRWPGDGRGVVVGVDGSDHAAKALRWAQAEADRRATDLTAVMAWGLFDQHHIEADAAFDPNYGAADARAALEHALGAALGDASQVKTKVVNDLPARGLVETSRTAELLVVGARGLGGFGDLLLGSVSHRCLTHAVCPTVVVR
ncbi:MAG TPA: universal stress protein [Acidimicrobiales bacterium]|nr:universal stress protein [Acidimicrobiales bacterium]